MVRSGAIVGLTVFIFSFLSAGTSSSAAVVPAATCKALKAKGAGKYARGLIRAFGRNTTKPNTTKLGADLSKTSSILTQTFARAEGHGACATTGDAGTVAAKVDAFVLDAIEYVSAVCGDGMRSGPEECDPPDDSACPGRCRADCSCSPCGDGVMSGTEECDPPEDSACPGLCRADCSCSPPACGDGVMSGTEECDPPEDSACPGLCSADCSCAAPGCGNDIIEPGEACDGSALGTCYECGAPGTSFECQCCWPTGWPYACMGIPCCDPAARCLVGGPGQGYVCTTCSSLGGPCGGVDGLAMAFCCEGLICVPDLDWYPAYDVGLCHSITCTQPADCVGTEGCENGLCCAQTGEVCGGGFLSGNVLSCCGGASCSKPVPGGDGFRACCLPAGTTCASGAECCSDSCNAGTSTCDP